MLCKNVLLLSVGESSIVFLILTARHHMIAYQHQNAYVNSKSNFCEMQIRFNSQSFCQSQHSQFIFQFGRACVVPLFTFNREIFDKSAVHSQIEPVRFRWKKKLKTIFLLVKASVEK